MRRAVIALALVALTGAIPASAQTEDVKLTPADRASGDGLGRSVALDGDTALVGAPFHDGRGNVAGTAYVYRFVGGSWTQEAELEASEAAAGDRAGYAVAIDGDTVVVGAPNRRAVYVFARIGNTWTQQATLTGNYMFGIQVDIDGDTIVVGDSAPSVLGTIFTRTGTIWARQSTIPWPSGVIGVWELALSGDTAAFGVIPDSTFAGEALVYTRTAGAWSLQQRVRSTDRSANDEFGHGIDIQGDTLVVGAPGATTAPLSGAGAVYTFNRSGGGWTQDAKLLSPDAEYYEALGFSVGIDGDSIIAGAYRNTGSSGSPVVGAAYTFSRSSGPWAAQAQLTATDASAFDYFGWDAALSGETAVVGAWGNEGAGSAYLYDLTPCEENGPVSGPVHTDVEPVAPAAHGISCAYIVPVEQALNP